MLSAPAIQAYCYIPRIRHGEYVDFLIDTGASATCLSGIYALNLQEQMLPSTLENSCGIGGQCKYYQENAVLVFIDKLTQPLARKVKLGIQYIPTELQNDQVTLSIPSLLGRDILNRCNLTYNPNPGIIILGFR